ncbi:MAG: alpha/beta fold hydrolase [Acidobacteriota bacterium]
MQFTIDSREGLPIRGDFEIPEGARALVVIAHGFKGFKDWGFFPWLADYLCRERAAVCRFNMSRSGIGENSETFERLDLFADDTYSVQIDDLLDVALWCQARVDLPTFLVGHSRGGGVALLAAEKVEKLCGVVTWNAISRIDRWDEPTKAQWRRDGYQDVINARTKQVMRMSTRMLDDYEAQRERLDILGAVVKLEVPLLVVYGGRDESVPPSESREIAAYSPDAALIGIGTATHTFNAIHPLVTVPGELSLAAAVTARFVTVYG